MSLQGISTETLESSLDVYYRRLSNWNTTEDKKKVYLNRIDEIAEELEKRA